MRVQREEERAEAESALCQVGSWEGCLFPVTPASDHFLPAPQEWGYRGLQTSLCPREQAIGTVSCRVGRMSYFLREGRRLPHPVSLQNQWQCSTFLVLSQWSQPSSALQPPPSQPHLPEEAGSTWRVLVASWMSMVTLTQQALALLPLRRCSSRQRRRLSLLETLLQTQKELAEASQQLERLRQDMKVQQLRSRYGGGPRQGRKGSSDSLLHTVLFFFFKYFALGCVRSWHGT